MRQAINPKTGEQLKGYFVCKKDRNLKASGSQTPHVNIHLGKMRPLHKFLTDEFGIDIQNSDYAQILDLVRNWPIEKPAGTVTWAQFRASLQRYSEICPWLKGKFKDDQGGIMSWEEATLNGVGKRKAA